MGAFQPSTLGGTPISTPKLDGGSLHRHFNQEPRPAFPHAFFLTETINPDNHTGRSGPSNLLITT
jgi:hypothetical protein